MQGYRARGAGQRPPAPQPTIPARSRSATGTALWRASATNKHYDRLCSTPVTRRAAGPAAHSVTARGVDCAGISSLSATPLSPAERGERLSQAVGLVTRITIISLKFTDRSILSQLASSTIDAIHRLPPSIFSPALATPTPPFVGHSRPSRLFFLSFSLERRPGCTGQPGPRSRRSGRWPVAARRAGPICRGDVTVWPAQPASLCPRAILENALR